MGTSINKELATAASQDTLEDIADEWTGDLTETSIPMSRLSDADETEYDVPMCRAPAYSATQLAGTSRFASQDLSIAVGDEAQADAVQGDIANWIKASETEDQAALRGYKAFYKRVIITQVENLNLLTDFAAIQTLYPESDMVTYALDIPYEVSGIPVHVVHEVTDAEGVVHFLSPSGPWNPECEALAAVSQFDVENHVLEITDPGGEGQCQPLNGDMGVARYVEGQRRVQMRAQLTTFLDTGDAQVLQLQTDQRLDEYLYQRTQQLAPVPLETLAQAFDFDVAPEPWFTKEIALALANENTQRENELTQMRRIVAAKRADHPDWDFEAFERVTALYIQKETGITLEMALFCGIVQEEDGERLVLLDLCDGSVYRSQSTTEGTDSRLLLYQAMTEFSEGNQYGAGYLKWAYPGSWHNDIIKSVDLPEVFTAKMHQVSDSLWEGVDKTAMASGLVALGLRSLPLGLASMGLNAASSVRRLDDLYTYERVVGWKTHAIEWGNLAATGLSALALGNGITHAMVAANITRYKALQSTLMPYLPSLEILAQTGFRLSVAALSVDATTTLLLANQLYADLQLDDPTLLDEERAKRVKFLIGQIGLQAFLVVYCNRDLLRFKAGPPLNEEIDGIIHNKEVHDQIQYQAQQHPNMEMELVVDEHGKMHYVLGDLEARTMEPETVEALEADENYKMPDMGYEPYKQILSPNLRRVAEVHPSDATVVPSEQDILGLLYDFKNSGKTSHLVIRWNAEWQDIEWAVLYRRPDGELDIFFSDPAAITDGRLDIFKRNLTEAKRKWDNNDNNVQYERAAAHASEEDQKHIDRFALHNLELQWGVQRFVQKRTFALLKELDAHPNAEIRVGRSPTNRSGKVNHIIIPDGTISAAHCQLGKEGNRFYIIDTGSTNGTYINGKKVPPNQKIYFDPEADVVTLHEPDNPKSIYLTGSPHQVELLRLVQGELQQFAERNPGVFYPIGSGLHTKVNIADTRVKMIHCGIRYVSGHYEISGSVYVNGHKLSEGEVAMFDPASDVVSLTPIEDAEPIFLFGNEWRWWARNPQVYVDTIAERIRGENPVRQVEFPERYFSAEGQARSFIQELDRRPETIIRIGRLALDRENRINHIAFSQKCMGISAFHGWLGKEGNRYFIVDADSRNGVYLNGTQISAQRKVYFNPDSDVVRLGEDAYLFGSPRVSKRQAGRPKEADAAEHVGKEVLSPDQETDLKREMAMYYKRSNNPSAFTNLATIVDMEQITIRELMSSDITWNARVTVLFNYAQANGKLHTLLTHFYDELPYAEQSKATWLDLARLLGRETDQLQFTDHSQAVADFLAHSAGGMIKFGPNSNAGLSYYYAVERAGIRVPADFDYFQLLRVEGSVSIAVPNTHPELRAAHPVLIMRGKQIVALVPGDKSELQIGDQVLVGDPRQPDSRSVLLYRHDKAQPGSHKASAHPMTGKTNRADLKSKGWQGSIRAKFQQVVEEGLRPANASLSIGTSAECKIFHKLGEEKESLAPYMSEVQGRIWRNRPIDVMVEASEAADQGIYIINRSTGNYQKLRANEAYLVRRDDIVVLGDPDQGPILYRGAKLGADETYMGVNEQFHVRHTQQEIDDAKVVLNLGKGASKEECQKAFRRLAMKYHPDINPGNAAAAEKFRQVQDAWDIINSAP